MLISGGSGGRQLHIERRHASLAPTTSYPRPAHLRQATSFARMEDPGWPLDSRRHPMASPTPWGRMEHVRRRTTADNSENQLSIQLPEHDPLISPQVATKLLRLIRNVNRSRTEAHDQQEKV